MTEHTPTPWRLQTEGNMGSLIEAHSGRRVYDFDDGYRTVASYQECCASEMYADQEANRQANGAFIVKAVNNHQPLVEALKFALEVMESYAVSAGNDPRTATPESAIGRARDALAHVSEGKQP